MAKSKAIRCAKILRTGALTPLNPKNERLLTQPGIVEVMAERNADSGKYEEVGGSDQVNNVIASSDLVRITRTLGDVNAQREALITAACKLDGGQQYLENMGLFNPETDMQLVVEDDDETITLPDTPEPVAKGAIKKLSQKELEAQKAKASKEPTAEELASI